jgi:O-antigen ligase
MLLPFAIYRAVSFGQKRWWIAAGLILLGSLTTRSRTGFLMLLVIALVYLLLRPRETKRFWPAIIPALIMIHFILPGTLGTIKESFFPKGGIIAQQQNASVGSGRLATLGPALHTEFTPNPILGEGFGTRVTTPDPVLAHPNGPILDDEWLGVLLETGVVGTLALVWLFVRALRRMGKVAKRDFSPRGWLLVAATASIGGYGLGMFTYDAFSFIQVTFLLFIVLGIGAVALKWPQQRWEQLANSA